MERIKERREKEREWITCAMMFYKRKGGKKVDKYLEEPPGLSKIDSKHRAKATLGK